MLEGKRCYFVMIWKWNMEIYIYEFTAFFRGGHFENDPGKAVHHKISMFL